MKMDFLKIIFRMVGKRQPAPETLYMREKTDFEVRILNRFDENTLLKVQETFRNLGLPVPEQKMEFLAASKGALVFLNDYGLVIRIENAYAERVNNSPWVLQPLATINAGEVLIEICPGTHIGSDSADMDFLLDHLKTEGVDYEDAQRCNGGRLPIRMPHFPEGVPIVIDRLAVGILTDQVSAVADALMIQQAKEAQAAQEELYGPLRRQFYECWPDVAKMKTFWETCADYKQQGKLLSAWMDTTDTYEATKTGEAKENGAQYAQRLEAFRQADVKSLTGSSTASATRKPSG